MKINNILKLKALRVNLKAYFFTLKLYLKLFKKPQN